MSKKLDDKKCILCENEECTCENIEVCPLCENEECACEEVSQPIRRKIKFDFEEYPEESFCEYGCDCEGECEAEYIEDVKKSLTILGATVATVAVAGGILYLVKRKK